MRRNITSGPTPNSRKKKPLTEMELALKREETARKRRNLTEKKLEDEKVPYWLYSIGGDPNESLTMACRPKRSTVCSKSKPGREESAMRSPLPRIVRRMEAGRMTKRARRASLLSLSYPPCTAGYQRRGRPLPRPRKARQVPKRRCLYPSQCLCLSCRRARDRSRLPQRWTWISQLLRSPRDRRRRSAMFRDAQSDASIA